jgi:hypothetical protein
VLLPQLLPKVSKPSVAVNASKLDSSLFIQIQISVSFKRNKIMAHQLEQMAYVGETPWHGLGNQLTQNQPIEVWAQQAGMDWRSES